MKELIELNRSFKIGICIGAAFAGILGTIIYFVLTSASPYIGNNIGFWLTVSVVFLIVVEFSWIVAPLLHRYFLNQSDK